MDTTITLDRRHFKAAAEKARQLGKTPQTFIESLIDASTLTLDEVLAPVREGFAKSGNSEEELDAAVAEARKAFRARPRRKAGK